MSKYSNVEEMIRDLTYVRPNSYMGPDYYGYITIYGMNRDSNYLDQYNYQEFLERLNKVLKDNKIENDELILDICDSHWACGYVNFLRVKESNKLLMNECLKILNGLDSYPVIDDMGYSEYCRDRVLEQAKSNSSWDIGQLYTFLGVKKLNKEQAEYFCQLSYECTGGYYGEEEAYFSTDTKTLKEVIKYIRDNRLEEYCNKIIKKIESKIAA